MRRSFPILPLLMLIILFPLYAQAAQNKEADTLADIKSAFKEKRYDEALKIIDTELSKKDSAFTTPYLHYYKGIYYHLTDKKKKALGFYKKAFEKSRFKDLSLRYGTMKNTSMIYKEMGLIPEAFKAIDEAKSWTKGVKEKDEYCQQQYNELMKALPYIDDPFHRDIFSIFNNNKDAKLIYTLAGSHKQAIMDMDMVFRPPLKPDNKIYLVAGIIENTIKGGYILKAKKSDKRFFIKDAAITERGKQAIQNLRLNSEVAIYGRFVNLLQYQTVLGETKTAPLFNALHVEACKYINTHRTTRCICE